jgi:hypothetical protein
MHDSSFGRLIGVLVSPGKTFESIARRPTWVVPLLVLALVAGGVWYLAGQRTDYRDVITKSVTQSGREVPEEQLEPQIEFMEKAGPIITAVSTPFVILLVTLIVALLYWVAFKLLGSDLSYKDSLATTLHASMPAVIAMLLSIPVILGKESLGYEDTKTGSFLASSLALFAPEDAPGWLNALLASVDFFSLWALALTIIGFRAVARLSTKMVAVTAIVLWLLFVGLRVGWAALFT